MHCLKCFICGGLGGGRYRGGVGPLRPVTHRNVSFQRPPRPLGFLQYHYGLAENIIDRDTISGGKLEVDRAGNLAGRNAALPPARMVAMAG